MNYIPTILSSIKKQIFFNNLRMLTTSLIAVFLYLGFHDTNAQQHRVVWSDVSESSIANQSSRVIIPQEYRTSHLDKINLLQILNKAPMEFSNDARSKSVLLEIPYPNGENKSFSIQNSPIMEEGLAVKYPEIRTFIAQGIDDPSASGQIGFHSGRFSRHNIYK